MHLIGLCGPTRSGKTTFGKIIVDEAAKRGSKYAHFDVSDALLDELATATGYSAEQITAQKEAFRPLLRCWGTEFRRRICGENYWVIKLADKLNADLSLEGAVISGLRYPSDFHFLRTFAPKVPTGSGETYPDYTLIRIWRKKPSRLFYWTQLIRTCAQHSSEKLWWREAVDYEVYNAYQTADELRPFAKRILR